MTNLNLYSNSFGWQLFPIYFHLKLHKNTNNANFVSITSFCRHLTYRETIWKLWNEAWNGPMEMFCSRHTFYLWPYMVSCGALQWNFSHKMTLVHLKVPYYHALTLSSNACILRGKQFLWQWSQAPKEKLWNYK